MAKCAGQPKYFTKYHHSVAVHLNERGWTRTVRFSEATVALLTQQGVIQSRPHTSQWVWLAVCEPLACKARLFERLECATRKTLKQGVRRWPETWVIRSNVALLDWYNQRRASCALSLATRFFVKHPRTSGGTGTVPAGDVPTAHSHAANVLVFARDAVVIQRAVDPGTLPRGASLFELRVWALLRRTDCWLFELHRAKTATSGLMNQMVQRGLGAFGLFYADNIASEAHVREALGGNIYDTRTKPDIAAAVKLAHGSIRHELPCGSFVFVGFDFIVDQNARAWLIEANVKPAFRYADLASQFPSPLVRRLADRAIADLARVFDGGLDPAPHGPAWIKLPG